MLEKYQKFIFEGYRYDYIADEELLTISLNYSFDGIEKFAEKLTLKVGVEQWSKVNLKALEKALKALFLMGGISYYKAFCPKVIELKMMKLDEQQAVFWNKLYEHGLGEFFYQNKIDFRGLINFKANVEQAEKGLDLNLKEKALLPIGGGKDSIVSAEILKMGEIDFVSFNLREAEAIRQTAEIIGKDRIIVGRELDKRLFVLNEQGALNGHVPITAQISFLLVVCAIIYDFKYLVFSLEKSANYGQMDFFGLNVNHQYSKSEEFEGDFRKYIAEYIAPGIEFFSLLRGFYEMRIIEIFTGLKNLESYLPVFTSCNANFKVFKEKSATKWCGECPKCAFIFLCLAAFLKREVLIKTFGKNLFEDSKLLLLYEELLGLKNFKPFECVGTTEECLVAMRMVAEKPEFAEDFLVKYFKQELLPKLGELENLEKAKQTLLKMQNGHFIPPKFEQLLNKINHAD